MAPSFGVAFSILMLVSFSLLSAQAHVVAEPVAAACGAPVFDRAILEAAGVTFDADYWIPGGDTKLRSFLGRGETGAKELFRADDKLAIDVLEQVIERVVREVGTLHDLPDWHWEKAINQQEWLVFVAAQAAHPGDIAPNLDSEGASDFGIGRNDGAREYAVSRHERWCTGQCLIAEEAF
jgi:hypothetical protein